MAKNIYEDFLRLTGFEEDEMSKYLPEWRKASEKLRLTEDDVRFATEKWIPTYFQVELEGVRKSLGAIIREAIDLTKANEYKEKGMKIVYGILPAILHYYYALKLTAPEKVYVAFPDIFLTMVLNALFHKLDSYLEEAEEGGIPYGCRHCALNKARYAARRLRIIPAPDVNWIWGFICDEGPKTDEFIKVYHDPEWKTYITRLPHDQPLYTVEDEVVEAVIQRLTQTGLLNDREFAHYWVENRLQFNPRGARALHHELRAKGISESIITDTLKDLDEEAAAHRAAESGARRLVHREPRDFRRRLRAYLMRRGFSYAVIKPLVEEMWEAMGREASPDTESEDKNYG